MRVTAAVYRSFRRISIGAAVAGVAPGTGQSLCSRLHYGGAWL